MAEAAGSSSELPPALTSSFSYSITSAEPQLRSHSAHVNGLYAQAHHLSPAGVSSCEAAVGDRRVYTSHAQQVALAQAHTEMARTDPALMKEPCPLPSGHPQVLGHPSPLVDAWASPFSPPSPETLTGPVEGCFMESDDESDATEAVSGLLRGGTAPDVYGFAALWPPPPPLLVDAAHLTPGLGLSGGWGDSVSGPLLAMPYPGTPADSQRNGGGGRWVHVSRPARRGAGHRPSALPPRAPTYAYHPPRPCPVQGGAAESLPAYGEPCDRRWPDRSDFGSSLPPTNGPLGGARMERSPWSPPTQAAVMSLAGEGYPASHVLAEHGRSVAERPPTSARPPRPPGPVQAPWELQGGPPRVAYEQVADCMPAAVLREVFNRYMDTLLHAGHHMQPAFVDPATGVLLTSFEVQQRVLQEVLLFQDARVPQAAPGPTASLSPPMSAVGVDGCHLPCHVDGSGGGSGAAAGHRVGTVGTPSLLQPAEPWPLSRAGGPSPADSRVEERPTTSLRARPRAGRLRWTAVVDFLPSPVPLSFAAAAPEARRCGEQRRWRELLRDAVGAGGVFAMAVRLSRGAVHRSGAVDLLARTDGHERAYPPVCRTPLPRYLADPTVVDGDAHDGGRSPAPPLVLPCATLVGQRLTLLLNAAWRGGALLRCDAPTRHFGAPSYTRRATAGAAHTGGESPLAPLARTRVREANGLAARVPCAGAAVGLVAARSASAQPISLVLQLHRDRRAGRLRAHVEGDPEPDRGAMLAGVEGAHAAAETTAPPCPLNGSLVSELSTAMPPPSLTTWVPPQRQPATPTPETPPRGADDGGAAESAPPMGPTAEVTCDAGVSRGRLTSAARLPHSSTSGGVPTPVTAAGPSCAMELLSDATPLIAEDAAGTCHVFFSADTVADPPGLAEGWLDHLPRPSRLKDAPRTGRAPCPTTATTTSTTTVAAPRPLALHLTEEQLPWLARRLAPEGGGLPSLRELYCCMDEGAMRRRPELRAAWAWVKSAMATRGDLQVLSIAPRRSQPRDRSALARAVQRPERLGQPGRREEWGEEAPASGERHDGTMGKERRDGVAHLGGPPLTGLFLSTSPLSPLSPSDDDACSCSSLSTSAAPSAAGVVVDRCGRSVVDVSAVPADSPPNACAAAFRTLASTLRSSAPPLPPSVPDAADPSSVREERQSSPHAAVSQRGARAAGCGTAKIDLPVDSGAGAVSDVLGGARRPLRATTTRPLGESPQCMGELGPHCGAPHDTSHEHSSSAAVVGARLDTARPQPRFSLRRDRLTAVLAAPTLQLVDLHGLSLAGLRQLLPVRPLTPTNSATATTAAAAASADGQADAEPLPCRPALRDLYATVGSDEVIDDEAPTDAVLLHSSQPLELVLSGQQLPSLEVLWLRAPRIRQVHLEGPLHLLRELHLSLDLTFLSSSLAGLARLPSLQVLRLERVLLGGLGFLGECASLRELHLHACRVSTLGSDGPPLLGVERAPALTLLSLAYTLDIKDLTNFAACVSLQRVVLTRCNGVSSASIAGLEALPRLTHLSLEYTRVSSVSAFAMCPALAVVRLDGCKRVLRSSIEGLEQSPSLRELSLAGTNVVTIASLGTAASLIAALDLSGCAHLDDAGVDGVRALQHLEILNLSGTLLTRLDVVADCPALTTLYVEDCVALRPDALTGVRAARRLRRLIADGCATLAEAGGPLAQCPRLQCVSLARCTALGDSGVRGLESISTLESLDLTGCSALTSVGFLAEGGARLRALALGGCPALTEATLAGVERLPELTDLALDNLPALRSVNFLARSATLRRLSLRGCDALDYDGVAALLSTNVRLEL